MPFTDFRAGRSAAARVPRQHRLANGLLLVYEQQPWLETLSVTLLFPLGSATDPEGEEGSATVLHGWLQRGAGDRDSRALSDALDDLGVIRGGGAGREHATLSAAFLAADLEAALPLIASMVAAPRLEDSEFEGARDLVLEELASLEDSPTQRLLVALQERFFSSPHGRSPVGTLEGLMAITPASVRADAARRLGPGGAILAVAGGADFERVTRAAEASFGGWSGASAPVPAPSTHAPARHHVAAESKQVQIGLAFPAFVPGSDDAYRNALAIAVLSGGSSSRLFSEVREKRGLVYSVDAASRSLKGYGYTIGYAGTTPERAPETLEVYLHELARLRDGVTPEEFARAKVGLLSGLVMTGESSGATASRLANDTHTIGRPRTLAEITEKVESIDVDELNAFLAAREPVDPTIVTLGPAVPSGLAVAS